MVMEERIVLDGSVAAVVATSGAAQADAADSATGSDMSDLPVDPVEHNSTDPDPDNDSESSDNTNTSHSDNNDDGSYHDNNAYDNGVADIIAAIAGNDSLESAGLKALIINSDINDVNDLIDAVSEGVIVITFDGDTQDLQGIIDQLRELSGGREFDSIGIITHGEEGAIALTQYEEVTGESLGVDVEQREFFSALGGLISDDGRIDLISCDSGVGELGDELITALEAITGAEVTASIDDTGNVDADGDWILEKGNVDIESEYFDGYLLDNFDGLLPTPCPHYNPELDYTIDDTTGMYGEITLTFKGDTELYGCAQGFVAISQVDNPLNFVILSDNFLETLLAGDDQHINIDLSHLTEATIDTNLKSLSLIDGAVYKICISEGKFKSSTSDFVNKAINMPGKPLDHDFTFIVIAGSVVVVDEPTSHIPPHHGMPNTPSGGLGSNTGDDANGLVSDIIAAIEGDGSVDTADPILPDIGGDSDGGDSDGGEGNSHSSSVINVVTSSSEMMVSNPFSELITSEEAQVLFDNTVDAFAQFGMDNPAIFSMIQDAMGDTMTTASLVSSCEQCLENANYILEEVLAMNDDLELSGNGVTAEGENIATVIQSAIDDVVQARGNALIANDLLRVLAINIGDASERLAENSFSAGVTRLAECNENLAFSYEVLNSICRIVKGHKDAGQSLSVEQLNGIMPEIISNARSVSGDISENGDRASKDVLAFLTRNMQNKGIDKENLQQQVATVFEQWHDSLGVTPVEQMNFDLDSDVAGASYIPVEAM